LLKQLYDNYKPHTQQMFPGFQVIDVISLTVCRVLDLSMLSIYQRSLSHA